MTGIILITRISAPIEKCFDLARSIEIHQLSTASTKERAIRGRTAGLCETGDEITWEATHFGIRQQLSVKITKMDRPYFFEDMMLKGAFRSMQHRHYFDAGKKETIMTDVFEYTVPYGPLGYLFNILMLKRYMRKFLLKRNQVLKATAEDVNSTDRKPASGILS